jgi:hypothetical protein
MVSGGSMVQQQRNFNLFKDNDLSSTAEVGLRLSEQTKAGTVIQN